MIIECGSSIRDPEVVEVCEKLVGHNLSEFYLLENGAEQVLSLYEGFMSNEHSRPKIIEILLASITEHIAKLTLERQIDFVSSMQYIVSDQAVFSVVPGAIATIEPYFVEKL
jgi:hypothetical protein